MVDVELLLRFATLFGLRRGGGVPLCGVAVFVVVLFLVGVTAPFLGIYCIGAVLCSLCIVLVVVVVVVGCTFLVVWW